MGGLGRELPCKTQMGLKCVVLARFGDHGRPKHGSPLSSGRMELKYQQAQLTSAAQPQKSNRTSSASSVKELYFLRLGVLRVCSVASDSLRPRGLWPIRLLCP